MINQPNTPHVAATEKFPMTIFVASSFNVTNLHFHLAIRFAESDYHDYQRNTAFGSTMLFWSSYKDDMLLYIACKFQLPADFGSIF